MASLLAFSYRLMQIIALQSATTMRLMQLRQNLLDFQSYASAIGDGAVSMQELMNAPATMFNNMSIFMNQSHQVAFMSAQQGLPYMLAMNQGFVNQQTPELQMQYQQMIFNNLYAQARQRTGEVEKERLNKQETKINQEIAILETRLKMLDNDEKNTKEAMGKAADNSGPKFGLA